MLVAQQKRKENIAEYILYLYQVEDLIRAFQLDLNLINDKLVRSYAADEKTTAEISAWYENLVLMMEREGRQKEGHLQFLKNLVSELNEFHLRLMNEEVDEKYISVYTSVAGLVSELKKKNPDASGDVQVAIDGIYGYLMLKIQKKDISPETREAVTRLSHWLSKLSKLFKDYESGDLQM
jgi:hypothetical protein